jgi:hypothetical protein
MGETLRQVRFHRRSHVFVCVCDLTLLKCRSCCLSCDRARTGVR